MPTSITVPFKVLARGYQVSGDVRSGYKASVPYLLAWADAFVFADQVFGSATASVVGPVTWFLPYAFPGSAARLYAQSFTIAPCGAGGSAAPTKGLAPGEFFTHAIVTVEFESPPSLQQAADDPGGLSQLDPQNPITLCEQSVRSAGKMETRRGGSYIYDDDSKPVHGDFAVPTAETRLVLSFPRVPYLPWSLIKPYLNKINSTEVLGVGAGQLLLEEFDTKVAPSSDGKLSQQVQLSFAYSDNDWNKLPKPDGTLQLVRLKADSGSGSPRRIYASADFRQIFAKLSFQAQ